MNQANPSVLLVDDVDANLLALEAQLSSPRLPTGPREHGQRGTPAAAQERLRGRVARRANARHGRLRGCPARAGQPRDARRAHRFRDGHARNRGACPPGYDIGAFDFLFKPVNPHILRSKVRVFLDLFVGREKLNEEIRAHKRTLAELERLSRFKSQFLANMSHELRTPLNAIIGFSEILSDDESGTTLSTEQKEHIGYVLDGGRHLLSLINDVLDSEREAQDASELHPEGVTEDFDRFGARHRAAARPQTGREPRHRSCRRSAANLGRPRPHEAGALQPSVERHQIHASWR